ncbi:MAG: hypothetical protein PHY92_10630, partial [Alphaproteobacteria bacterium]|nr:hypothetical protein [Alphaproteobacteria bacterium]
LTAEQIREMVMQYNLFGDSKSESKDKIEKRLQGDVLVAEKTIEAVAGRPFVMFYGMDHIFWNPSLKYTKDYETLGDALCRLLGKENVTRVLVSNTWRVTPDYAINNRMLIRKYHINLPRAIQTCAA